jgi:hypothetical protein
MPQFIISVFTFIFLSSLFDSKESFIIALGLYGLLTVIKLLLKPFTKPSKNKKIITVASY